MKNFYFSIVLFIVIIAGSVFSNAFLRNELKIYEAGFGKIINSEEISQTDIESIKNIKEKFYKQKNMLQLFVSKEHIKDIEANILLIENSLAEDRLSDSKEKCLEALTTIRQITDYLTSVD